MLILESLRAEVEGREILRGVSLEIGEGEKHVIFGPNGSGKTTLAKVVMGIGKFAVKGKILFEGKDITNMAPWERFRRGIFLVFQHPPSLEGIKIERFLRKVYGGDGFREKLLTALEEVGLDVGIVKRDFDDSLSGGERKRLELLQLILAEPKLAIVDEIDSGLDADGIKAAQQIIDEMARRGTAFIIITHTGGIVKGNEHTFHLMARGRIVREGGFSIFKDALNGGYAGYV